jgi:hypothetical protein
VRFGIPNSRLQSCSAVSSVEQQIKPSSIVLVSSLPAFSEIYENLVEHDVLSTDVVQVIRQMYMIQALVLLSSTEKSRAHCLIVSSCFIGVVRDIVSVTKN